MDEQQMEKCILETQAAQGRKGDYCDGPDIKGMFNKHLSVGTPAPRFLIAQDYEGHYGFHLFGACNTDLEATEMSMAANNGGPTEIYVRMDQDEFDSWSERVRREHPKEFGELVDKYA